MRKIVFLLLVFNVLLFAYELRVAKVYDGDTMTLKDNKGNQYKIRLFGIDAPELKQSYGKAAKKQLLKLCPLKSLAKIKITDTDRYKRLVAIVECGGTNANAFMVFSGYAWAYEEYSKAYVKLQKEAMKNKRGLWQEKNPLKPSLYRKRSR